jgi:ABC-type Mn2+/Zn2+ transport system permease subunit
MIQATLDAFAFVPWAFAAGTLVAVTCAVFGVLVILRRVVFIGITLAEVAAFGVAVALALGVAPSLGAIVLTVATAIYVAQPRREAHVPRDAILGIIFAGAAAGSVLVVARSGFGLHEIKSLLYGDLILAAPAELAAMSAILIPALLMVILFLRPLLQAMVDADYAHVQAISVRLWDCIFFIALSLAVAAASKTTGSLLVFTYLIVLPAAALMLSRRLTVVLIFAALLNALATSAGLIISFATDLPSNPTIIACALGLFLVTVSLATLSRMLRRRKPPVE